MILLTGVPGWLSLRFIDLTDDKEEIRCLVLPKDLAEVEDKLKNKKNVVLCKGDVRVPATLREFFAGATGATLYHAAGVIHPYRFVREFYEVNVGGAVNILEAAKEAGVQTSVLVSSNSPIGCNPNPTHRFNEHSPFNPYMNYGRSKMLMEQAAERMSHERNMDIRIIRVCWFYGKHQPKRQADFYRLVREGAFPIVGSGENQRSLSLVDDICQGMKKLAEAKDASGQVYWLADTQPYSMNKIIGTIARVLRDDFQMTVKPPRIRLPHVIGTIARCVDSSLQTLGLYHQKIHVLSEMNCHIACSVEAAKRDLGFVPTDDLATGMRASIEDCLQKGYLV